MFSTGMLRTLYNHCWQDESDRNGKADHQKMEWRWRSSRPGSSVCTTNTEALQKPFEVWTKVFPEVTRTYAYTRLSAVYPTIHVNCDNWYRGSDKRHVRFVSGNQRNSVFGWTAVSTLPNILVTVDLLKDPMSTLFDTEDRYYQFRISDVATIQRSRWFCWKFFSCDISTNVISPCNIKDSQLKLITVSLLFINT